MLHTAHIPPLVSSRLIYPPYLWCQLLQLPTSIPNPNFPISSFFFFPSLLQLQNLTLIWIFSLSNPHVYNVCESMMVVFIFYFLFFLIFRVIVNVIWICDSWLYLEIFVSETVNCFCSYWECEPVSCDLWIKLYYVERVGESRVVDNI